MDQILCSRCGFRKAIYLDRSSGHRMCGVCLYRDVESKIREVISRYARDLRNSYAAYIDFFQPVPWNGLVIRILARILGRAGNRLIVLLYPWYSDCVDIFRSIAGDVDLIILGKTYVEEVLRICSDLGESIDFYACILKHQMLLGLSLRSRGFNVEKIFIARPREFSVDLALKVLTGYNREILSEVYNDRTIEGLHIVNILDRVSESSLISLALRDRDLENCYEKTFIEYVSQMPEKVRGVLFRENTVISMFKEIFYTSYEYMYTFPESMKRYYSLYSYRCRICSAPLSDSDQNLCRYCLRLTSALKDFSQIFR
ncbi:MAG: hypothetical protein QXU60_01545 [Sulfolobales archaeon]